MCREGGGKESPGVITLMNPGPYRPLYLWGPLVGGGGEDGGGNGGGGAGQAETTPTRPVRIMSKEQAVAPCAT